SPPLSEGWETDFESAQATARAQQKPILMVFSGSDWCKNCIQLRKQVFESEVFRTQAPEDWVLVEVDFPRARKNRLSAEQQAHNKALAERYNPKGSFPYVLAIHPDGSPLAEVNTQLRNPVQFLTHLTALTAETP
ncbi:MAG: thioredoxin family protein, partial [Bacteroidota bacterium]